MQNQSKFQAFSDFGSRNIGESSSQVNTKYQDNSRIQLLPKFDFIA